jgi:hypothetical protein
VYSGKIAVPPGGGGLRKKADRKKCFPQETKAEFLLKNSIQRRCDKK